MKEPSPDVKYMIIPVVMVIAPVLLFLGPYMPIPATTLALGAAFDWAIAAGLPAHFGLGPAPSAPSPPSSTSSS